MTADFKVTKDDTKKVLAAIRRLSAERVLVGIPDKTAGREDPNSGQPISNAVIGYIQERGSPAANIPARPHLVPGVESILPKVTATYRSAGRAALSGDAEALNTAHQRVGLIAQNAVRRRITEGPFIPLSPVTLHNRKTRKVAPRLGEKPLIDTGQYRRSITFVVRQQG